MRTWLALLLAIFGLREPLPAAPIPPRRALWVYETAALLSSPEAQADLFRFCAARHLTDLFWQMHFRNESKAGPYTLLDADRLPALLQAAGRHGLRLHALAGDPSHVAPQNHDRVLGRVDALIAFQRAAPADGRFAGLHLDIEPHALPEWKTSTDAGKIALLTQFVELNAKVAAKLRAEAPDILYGVDVAFWLDKTGSDGTLRWPVAFGGITQGAIRHLLGMTDHVALMSYRGAAEGPNGIIAIAEPSVRAADEARGRVFVGVKMAPIGPPMESFFGRTEAEMNAELRKVDDRFSPHPGYAGLAFFMYGAFRNMPPGNP